MSTPTNTVPSTTGAQANLRVPGIYTSSSSSGKGSESSLHVVKNVPGYKTPVFPAKEEQRVQVHQSVQTKGFLPQELVKIEVDWFYDNLGIEENYFANESVDAITDHIIALYAAKTLAYTKHSRELVIDLEKITENGAMFIHTSSPGVTSTEGPGATCERRIDDMFLDVSTPEKAYRLETYRSSGVTVANTQSLRCYFVSKCSLPTPLAVATPSVSDIQGKNQQQHQVDIRTVSDPVFLEKASENTLEIYQSVLSQVLSRDGFGPVIQFFEVEGTRERRVVIGYKMGTTQHFFSAISLLYHWYGLYSKRKYVEHFGCGVTIISLYLNPLPGANAPPIEHSIHQIAKEASLLYCLPDNPFFSNPTPTPNEPGYPTVPTESTHAVQEATYAYAGWIFAQHFCNRLGPAYQALRNVLDESNAGHAEVLNQIKKRFREETFTRQGISEAILAYPDLIRMLYVNFAMTHYPNDSSATQLMPTLSYQRLKTVQPLTIAELQEKIRKTVANKHDLQVFEALLTFNQHILKTNFYQPTKVAISFRLDGGFLPEIEYPTKPFGVFIVVGSDFRGFHVRFRDVARGGIRIVRSRGRENYSINQRTLFDENYALASTQALKNKDIPEGGAKGTILPSLGANPRLCFEKYVDAVIDLLIPGSSPGIKERLIDLYGKPEILFFGPDEGTADMMDWAAMHAHARGANWWKSFTTGKSAQKLGGIPHDTYGMTSLSVRQYVVGTYENHNLVESEITKVQTGGPDGDLGSNEILLSSEKYIAIIDGSGVLADPNGLDHDELVRLARARKMVSNFDRSKLSKDGYVVLVEDRDLTLPSGEVVPDGTDFRNSAHFRYKADLFVPCGGRPEAVNISNVADLFDEDGKCHFKYIIEGANLFMTQQARLYLEKRGIVVFKDASANKGGVTSSSLEVLAGLGLSDQEYLDLMVFKDGKPSSFYQAYVKEIQAKIVDNAALEYSCIWKEHSRPGSSKPRTIISDELSSTLNNLQAELESSDLFNDVASRRGVLNRAIPQTLVKQVGLDVLMKRLPEPYQRALFSSWVAAHFIYKYGVGGSNVDFFNFARTLAQDDKQ
ncbi:NAD-dependent glutamate dehydrogenase [Serendipita sp. 401]|nr:NAD-dependent glutamate dehydrogenase [Serendipita sp. 397]KAG8804756.1 NAD-dependent glutamate dehydrogenase [Serendipita sp. 398]KAG8825917.1 NAD-dependent glutamate dehydrogenase [Serendipita sp. 401]KAG8872954.1 NAD-dependent glutamate dehydrogenase [Serendipita sp. 405]KAG9055812.1 NAD-dependent glutamate dehydrogenase [Serendipita sp. 407]